ncbi:MAG TPA: hypothetical protein VFK80_07910 [Limnochordia bacterium]|nr:hypothetical protein [Limnochordia bacterium]
MRKLGLIAGSVMGMALAFSSVSFAEYTNTSVSASVNVNVSPVSVVAITTTSVTLNVNEAKAPDANGNFSGQLDAAATAGGTLSYTTNESNKKITATLGGGLASGTASGISIDVTALQGGTAKGHLTLDSGATSGDLISGLSTSSGSFDLSYSALVGLSVPPGTYSGTVTYTITDAGLL